MTPLRWLPPPPPGTKDPRDLSRKYRFGREFLRLGFILLLLSFALAWKNLLNEQWVSVVSTWISMGTVAFAAFNAADGYITGQALKHGADSKDGTKEAPHGLG